MIKRTTTTKIIALVLYSLGPFQQTAQWTRRLLFHRVVTSKQRLTLRVSATRSSFKSVRPLSLGKRVLWVALRVWRHPAAHLSRQALAIASFILHGWLGFLVHFVLELILEEIFQRIEGYLAKS
jgi:hypothetical protein